VNNEMKIHLLNRNCWQNARVPDERMLNISKCGKEVKEWNITDDVKEVTCKLCLKIINREEL